MRTSLDVSAPGHSFWILDWTYYLSFVMFITRISEVIMFSPCVSVCLCVCVSVYVCHDVCPDDLAMKDWCHIDNILQVYSWGCLVVQLMFHFEYFEIWNAALFWPQMLKDLAQIMPKKYLSWWWRHRVASKPYIFMFGRCSRSGKWQEQYLVNTCEYRNGLSRLYMPKDDLNR